MICLLLFVAMPLKPMYWIEVVSAPKFSVMKSHNWKSDWCEVENHFQEKGEGGRGGGRILALCLCRVSV